MGLLRYGPLSLFPSFPLSIFKEHFTLHRAYVAWGMGVWILYDIYIVFFFQLRLCPSYGLSFFDCLQAMILATLQRYCILFER